MAEAGLGRFAATVQLWGSLGSWGRVCVSPAASQSHPEQQQPRSGVFSTTAWLASQRSFELPLERKRIERRWAPAEVGRIEAWLRVPWSLVGLEGPMLAFCCSPSPLSPQSQQQ